MGCLCCTCPDGSRYFVGAHRYEHREVGVGVYTTRGDSGLSGLACEGGIPSAVDAPRHFDSDTRSTAEVAHRGAGWKVTMRS